MPQNLKRKEHWTSKSLQRLRLAHKTNNANDKPLNEPAALGLLMDGCSMEEKTGRPSATSMLRNTGFKILSIMRFSNSSGTRNTKRSSRTSCERDDAPTLDGCNPAPAMSCQFLTSLQPLEVTAIGKVFVPGLENVSVAHAPSVVTTAPTQDMVNDGSNHHHMTEYLKSAFNEGNIEGMCHAGLRAGMITPRLAHQLSHKLSIKFGNPTVVHRPSLRVRPSVRSVQDESRLPSANSLQDISLPESTNPSGCNDSGSISSSIQSTGETSLDFNAVSCHLSRTKEQNERYYVHRRGVTPNSKLCDKLQLPIQESPLAIIPTIVTVETTANAKIFFETHFNSILSNELSPRAQRRNDLELSLRKAELSAEQCQRKRVDWATKESEYLRRSRVLRSKMNEMKGNTGVAVAGYEVVRILGKGSFGVVRLVRHKDSKGERNFPQSHTLNLPRSFTCFPHEEPKNIKMAAIKAFDPAFDPTINNSKGSQDHHPQNITGEVFAMKVIRKSEMLRNAQEGHLRAERDFLVASERSRWVVPLVASFQDTKNLYLVMEYMVGGDFLALLFRKDTLKEKTARWYIAEMILCVEEAHKLQWIHRDVKPDNFLISASGHLKISDFGLAFDGHWSHDQSYFNNHRRSLLEKLGVKVGGDSIDRKEGKSIATGMTIANILTEHKEQNLKPQLDSPDGNERILQWRNRIGKRKLARSVVGTSQYMAPEIIRGELYDGRCDWWSIGIILYECIYGYTPFVSENRLETKANILANATSLRFPSDQDRYKRDRVSHDAMDLINNLLQEKEHRLCSKKYHLNDYQHSKHVPGRLVAARADTLAWDYQGHYVYPDDAADIKAHAFFYGLTWDTLHLSRPPFIPEVNGQDDTKYFDEDSISDADDASSISTMQIGLDTTVPAGPTDSKPFTSACTLVNKAVSLQKITEGMNIGKEKSGKAREKKRPRDRALRDKEVGKRVLELRKKGAFLGYTYRRPIGLFYEEQDGFS